MNIACVTCAVRLRVRKNEVIVCLTDVGNDYQLWYADLWECPECGHQIIGGWGNEPFAVWHQEGFEDEVEKQLEVYRVDTKLRELP